MVDAHAGQQDLAAGDPSGRIDQTNHRKTRDRFAGTGLADNAEHLALDDIEGNAVDGTQRMVAGQKLHPKVTHGKNGFAHLSFGLSASRSQSPSRLMERIRVASAMPGKATIHHSPEKRKLFPIRISVPSEGMVSGMPEPRNESVASVMMASARLMVAITRTGPIAFGST